MSMTSALIAAMRRPAAVPWRSRRPVVAAGLAAAATASLLVAGFPAAPAQAAPLDNTPLITYNMQGASSGSDSKWTTTIGRYARAAEIVLLQEAGPTPPGTFQAQIPMPGMPQVGLAGFVRHHRWIFGHESYEVFFLQTDANGGNYRGGRVNLAIVTQRVPNQVVAIPNPAGGRPALGVLFGNDWYFTVHAQALGGAANDAQALTNAIANFANARGESWTIGGDFNAEPGSFPPPLGSSTYRTGQATHQSGGEYDYAIASANIPNHPVARLNGASADHYAVGIGGLRAGAEPQALFSTRRTLENMQDGAVIESYDERLTDGNPVTAYRRTGARTQEWDMEFFNDGGFRLRMDNDLCAAMQWDRDAFRPLLRKCSDSLRLQRWYLRDVGDEQYEIRSVLGLCLDVGESQVPEGVDLHLSGCLPAAARQHWLINPAGQPEESEVGTNLVEMQTAFLSGGLENATTKQLLNHDHHSFASPVTTTPHQSMRTSGDQTFSFDWLDVGLFQIRDRLRNECLAQDDRFGRPRGDVTMDPCDRANELQRWRIELAGENEFRVVSDQAERPVCLYTVGLGLPYEGRPRALDCGNDLPTMRWYFAPTRTTVLNPN